MKISRLVYRNYHETSPFAAVQAIEEVLLKESFLVVVDNDSFVGLLRPSDILESPRMLVADCLHRIPVVDASQDVDSVIELMRRTNNSVLPVFEEKRFVGVIRQVDIAEHLKKHNRHIEKKDRLRTALLESVHQKLEREVSKLRQAREQLKKSETNLAKAQAIAHLGNWEWDITSGGLTWSEEVYRIFGLKPTEFNATYDAFLQSVHPEDRADVQRAVSRAIYEGEPYHSEHRVVRPDGEVRVVSEAGEVSYDLHGNPVHMLGTVLDITDRVQTERALKRSEAKYRELVENANSIILRFDTEGRVTFLNEYGLNFFGYTEEEILGRRIVGTITPEVESSGRNLAELMERVCLNPDRYLHHENENIKRDGERVWIAWTNRAILDDQGRLTGVLSVGNDITEHKLAEKALKDSEEKFRLVVENANEGIFVIQNEVYKFVNEYGLHLLKAEREEVVSSRIDRFVHPEDLNMILDRLRRRVAGETLQDTVEHRIIDGRGKVRWVEVRGAATEWDGQPAAMAFVSDITDRKMIEQELIDRQEKLISLASQLSVAEERERRRIASDLHDRVSQALALAQIKLEQLRQALAEPEQIETLGQVIGLIEGTIGDIRTLTFEISPQTLYELGLMPALEELADQFREKYDIQVTVEDEGRLESLAGDVSAALYRAARELLVNTVKHAQANRVGIVVKNEGTKIRLDVVDDGVGFDPARIEAEASRTKSFGLLSLRGRLAALGGEVWIDSQPGCGTRVTLLAPLS